MLTRRRTTGRKCSPNCQRYYLRILNRIDQIEQTLLHHLTDHPITTHIDVRPKTPRPKSKHKEYTHSKSKVLATPQSAVIKKTRISTDCDDIFPSHSARGVKIKQKQSSSILSTPQRKEPRLTTTRYSACKSNQDPSNNYLLNEAITARKKKESPVNQKQICSKKGEIFFDNLWLKWQQCLIKQNNCCKETCQGKVANKHRPTSIIHNNILNQYQGWNSIQLAGEINKLQQQFEQCLLEKRKTPLPQQLVLRENMSELSYRIAKIRQRQADILK